MKNEQLAGSGRFGRVRTRVVRIGQVPMGGDYPVRVQSMTSTDTLDTEATVNQAIRMIDEGCEYVRISVPGMREAENLRNIRDTLRGKGYSTPLIADVHFNPQIAELAATLVEKVRINPGNYSVESLRSLLDICTAHGTAVRIGVNHGSLSARIMETYGDTPEGMTESALEYARICRDHGFGNLVLSLKASNTRVMIAANRLLVKRMQAEGMDYPLHLGVTEAGAGDDGRLKSAVGIGSLLADGIGDTIRVSITEDPEFEIPVAYGILQATGRRITKTEYIACPSCARTLFDIQKTLKEIESRTSHLTGLKIAVMGCIVNGPGEMADADYGYVGSGKGKVSLYKGKEVIRKGIDESRAVDELIAVLKENGDWREE